jgi:O-succinylbenzoic acid--CoA ligase
MKMIMVGGSGLSVSLWEQAKAWKIPVYTTYGLSEMSSSITLSEQPVYKESTYHSGKLIPHRQIKIKENGRILVKGPTLFLGYMHAPRANGWFITGDMGFFDTNNDLHILGRQDNMFISGGENIYPEEIEQALLRIPEIEKAVVVPTEDIKFGSRPIAYIKTSKNIGDLLRRLSDELSIFLPKYKIPISYLQWPDDYNETSIKLDRAFFKKKSIIKEV